MSTLANLVCISCCALILVSCGGSTGTNTQGEDPATEDPVPQAPNSDGNDLPGTIINPTASGVDTEFLAVVNLYPSDIPNVDGSLIEAEFVRVEPRFADAAGFVFSNFERDMCTVFESDSVDGTFSLGEPVSAGENLIVSSDAGTLLTVPEDAIGEYGFKTSQVIEGAPPNTLVLDIPGAEFPMLSNVPLPRKPPDFFQSDILSPQLGGEVTANTVFRWRPSTSQRELDEYFVRIEFGRLNLVDLDQAGQPNDNFLEVVCHVTDDGEFAVPETVRETIGSDFSLSFGFIRREAIVSVVTGNLIFAAFHSSSPF